MVRAEASSQKVESIRPSPALLKLATECSASKVNDNFY